MTKVRKICREAWQVLAGDLVGKPMANFYSCRLASPQDGAKYRYESCGGKHDEKCIDFVFMITSGKSKLQSMRYKKSIWSRSDAKSHCSSRKGSFEA